MNEKQKQAAVIVGTVILAVLLLLFFRSRASGTTIARNSPYDIPGVGATQLGDIIIQGSGPIEIPGLNFGNPDLSMIGSCCMDCASSAAPANVPNGTSGFTYVYNAGDNGPNVYNYTNVTQTAPQSYDPFSMFRSPY